MSETRERVHIEDGPKRVRTYIGGKLIADTKRLKLVWEVPYYPAYYFPREDVRMELLTPNGTHSTRRAGATPTTSPSKVATARSGRRLALPRVTVEELRDLIRFDWNAMDGWFEEDEEVFSTHTTRTRASTSCTARGTSRSR